MLRTLCTRPVAFALSVWASQSAATVSRSMSQQTRVRCLAASESPEGDWRCSCGAAERAYHAGLAFGRRPVEVVALLKAHKLGIWHPPSQAPR